MVFEDKLSRQKIFIATACQDDLFKLDACRVDGNSLETIQISNGEIRFPYFPTRLVSLYKFHHCHLIAIISIEITASTF